MRIGVEEPMVGRRGWECSKSKGDKGGKEGQVCDVVLIDKGWPRAWFWRVPLWPHEQSYSCRLCNTRFKR